MKRAAKTNRQYETDRTRAQPDLTAEKGSAMMIKKLRKEDEA